MVMLLRLNPNPSALRSQQPTTNALRVTDAVRPIAWRSQLTPEEILVIWYQLIVTDYSAR
jgi:hypothetical protein